ncbi:hypothetical protein [Psychroflexus montanilacus]|uniref:hypothetical protein n=1 Tax=Psychroflexus montanilacus TaxID=2873598 RepID=UPI001CC8EEF7|nr:hypothetical protein [Psychroflexus montanilacus]MBZ9651509.1 hypothetical protein [Psychroflexus montanilacus]
MKTLLSKISLVAALAFMVGCSDTDRPIDELFDGTTRGTVLKTVESETSLEFNVGVENLVTIAAEVIDQRGQDFEKVDVFMSFRDNNPEDGDESRDEALFTTINPGDFDNSGEYPKLNLQFTEVDVNNFFDLTEEDYTGGDRFNVRLELVMNDGRVFTSTNANNVVTGGPFFRSPFQYNINVTCFIPEDYFVGEYTVEQISEQQNPFFGGNGPAFDSEPQTVNIERSGAQRIFTYNYFPESFASEITITLDLICGEIFVQGTGSGLACAAGAPAIGQSSPEVPSTFDLENDQEILLDLLDFEPDGDCGTGGYLVNLRFTKQTGN